MRSDIELTGQLVYLRAVNESLAETIDNYRNRKGYEPVVDKLNQDFYTNQGKIEALEYVLAAGFRRPGPVTDEELALALDAYADEVGVVNIAGMRAALETVLDGAQ